MISSLKSGVMGDCGAYIGAVTERQAIKARPRRIGSVRTAPPDLNAIS
jgi:hypothetical protein